MTNDEITRALAPLLLRPLRPEERRTLADVFERLAAQQRELADADARVGHVVRREQIARAPRGSKGGRPKGSGGRFIRWAPGNNHTGQLHIAPALYQEIGSPTRIDVQRIGAHLEIRPASGDAGYAVGHPTGPRGGMPRISIGRDAADILRLEAGRVPAEIRAGAIVA